MAEPDFAIQDHGTIALLTPQSDAAQDWAADHLPPDAQRRGRAFAVEPRYLAPILKGIEADGLTVGG
jgi:hypothetical protein